MKANNMINVPRFLWKLHGKQTYQFDLVLTYAFALIFTLFNLTFSVHLPFWKMAIIAILSVDIGGGVISNFTKGTITYYRESTLSPHAFVWFHAFQFAVLVWMYWESSIAICLIAFLTMLFSSVILALHKTKFQTQVSVFLFVILVLAVNLYRALPETLYLLLFLMSFKLLVGFSAHWKANNQ